MKPSGSKDKPNKSEDSDGSLGPLHHTYRFGRPWYFLFFGAVATLPSIMLVGLLIRLMTTTGSTDDLGGFLILTLLAGPMSFYGAREFIALFHRRVELRERGIRFRNWRGAATDVPYSQVEEFCPNAAGGGIHLPVHLLKTTSGKEFRLSGYRHDADLLEQIALKLRDEATA